MRRIPKKALSLLLAFAMLCGLAACGDGGNSEANQAAKEHVFRSEDVALSLEQPISNARSVSKVGDRLYLMSWTWDEMGQVTNLISMNLDGTDAKLMELDINSEQSDNTGIGIAYDGVAVPEEVPVEEPQPRDEEPETDVPESGETLPEEGEPEAETAAQDGEGESEASTEPESGAAESEAGEDETGESETGESTAPEEGESSDMQEKYPEEAMMVNYGYNINTMVSDGTGLYLLCNEYYNDYSDDSNPIYRESYYLIAIDLEGKEIWRQELGRNDNNTMSYFYVSSMVGTSQGILCSVQNDSGAAYVLYDSNGNKVDEFTLDLEESGNLFVSGKGDVYFLYWGQKDGSWQMIVSRLDLASKTLGEPLSIPGLSGYSLNFCQSVYGGEYDLYLYDSMAVYGYKQGDTDKTEIMNFIDSDLDTSNMNNLVIMDDQNFLMLQYDYEANNYEGQFILSRLTKVDPADVKDRTVMQLACYGNLWEIRPRVIAFNKSNENYRIQITDYQSYDTDNDWTAGMTRLNNDIVSGNVPDILYLNSNMPVSSYISKGLFADLYTFIDKDPDMKREDFISNILDAYSVDGKLYQLVPSFYISTVVGKTKYVGDQSGWTLADLQKLISSLPEGMSVFSETTQDGFLSMVMSQAGGQFVDWKNGTCSFDSDEFVELLEFCSTFPKEIDYEALYSDDSYWTTQETMYREDRTLLANLYLSNFRQYVEMRYGSFGEDITMVGFPSAPGNGAIIYDNLSAAISAKSKNQDGAWEFLRGYLLSEYQDTVSYAWPLRLDRLEEMKAEAKQKSYWEDPMTGEREEYDDTYYINGEEIILPLITDEEIQYVMDILTNVSEVAVYDMDLQNIVTEEAAAYFSGQKSAKEVAGIIQSRANIYVSENR